MELPLPLLLELVGPVRPMRVDGGIYFEGYSRVLYPTTASSDQSRIQWHVRSSKSPREKLQMNTSAYIPRANNSDPQVLAGARTFLGAFREACIILGQNRSSEYYRGIRYSGAASQDSTPSIGAPNSLTVGTSGMGIFGLTATMPIVYGKSVSRAAEGTDHDYLDILQLSQEMPIMLYDTDPTSERGWIVPLLYVILHMVRMWAATRSLPQSWLPHPPSDSEKEQSLSKELGGLGGIDLRLPIPKRDGDNHPSYTSQYKKTLAGLVGEFWKSLMSKEFDRLSIKIEPSIEAGAPKTFGWELLDIVAGKPCPHKHIPLHSNWEPLTQVVLVLFAQGLKEVLENLGSSVVDLARLWEDAVRSA